MKTLRINKATGFTRCLCEPISCSHLLAPPVPAGVNRYYSVLCCLRVRPDSHIIGLGGVLALFCEPMDQYGSKQTDGQNNQSCLRAERTARPQLRTRNSDMKQPRTIKA